MTYHKSRKRPASGSARTNASGNKLSPRISLALPEDDMRRLNWFAAQKNKPVAAVLRDAVWAYLLPIAADADREVAQ